MTTTTTIALKILVSFLMLLIFTDKRHQTLCMELQRKQGTMEGNKQIWRGGMKETPKSTTTTTLATATHVIPSKVSPLKSIDKSRVDKITFRLLKKIDVEGKPRKDWDGRFPAGPVEEYKRTIENGHEKESQEIIFSKLGE